MAKRRQGQKPCFSSSPTDDCRLKSSTEFLIEHQGVQEEVTTQPEMFQARGNIPWERKIPYRVRLGILRSAWMKNIHTSV
jgi:hypothetical protein